MSGMYSQAACQKAACMSDTFTSSKHGVCRHGADADALNLQELMDKLAAMEADLVGDMVVSAAIIAYLGPFTAAYRYATLTRK